MKPLRPNQEACCKKASLLPKDKRKFLIAAKCRFGKTFTALKIAFEAWHSEKVLIISGYPTNVKSEWEGEFKEFGKSPACFEFRSVQELNPEDDSKQALFDSYRGQAKRENGLTLIFDEAHHAEQTARTKKILEKINPTNYIDLTATPYTRSLIEQFGSYNTFTYSIQQEFEDFELDPFFVERYKYHPVEMRLSILEKEIDVCEDEKNNEIWSTQAVEKFKNLLKKDGYCTFIYFCNGISQCEKLQRVFEENGIDCCSIAGEEGRDITNAKKKVKAAKENGTFYGVFSCDRGGTGVTWNGLDCVVFYNAPNSAIDFVQKSYRCANPTLEEKIATVYCFNATSALNIFMKTNAAEAIYLKRKPATNFDDFKKVFQLTGKFKDYSFAQILIEIGKKFSYELIDFSFLDLSKFKFDKNKLSKIKLNLPEKSKDWEEAKKKAEEEFVKEKKKAAKDSEDPDKNREKERQVFNLFVGLFEEVDFLCKVYEIDISEISKYPEWLKGKIGLTFDIEDWQNFLEAIGDPDVVRNYLKQKVEDLKEKQEVEEKIEKELNSDSAEQFEENSIEDLQRRFPESKGKREIDCRNSDLQKTQKDLLMKAQGIMFGTEDDKIQYAHITPFKDVSMGKEVYDFWNAILIPRGLHLLWDDKMIDFEIVKEGRNEGRLKVKKLVDCFDTANIQTGMLSYETLTDRQIYYFEKRAALEEGK